MTTGIARLEAKNLQDVANGVAGASYTPPPGHFIQCHIGDPGPLGTANVAAFSTRLSVTWGACSSTTGAGANANTLTLATVPANENITHWTEWSTATLNTRVLASGTTSFGNVTAGSSPTIPIGSLTKTWGVMA